SQIAKQVVLPQSVVLAVAIRFDMVRVHRKADALAAEVGADASICKTVGANLEGSDRTARSGIGALGDDMDGAASRSAAVGDRAAARQNLDALDGLQRDRGKARRSYVVLVDAHTIDQHQGILVRSDAE